jgi:REP element-mobilizing transposase RayT
MARSIRIENPESVYHVYSRGNYREPIFRNFRTAEVFLKILEETIIRTDWHVYAFAIMPNHFHFVVKAPRANLSRGMHLLLTTFASRFNRFREEHGHVFQGRYQAKRIPTGFDVSRVIDYVHLNHVRKGIYKVEELSGSPLSSVSILMNPDNRSVFKIRDGLKFFGYPDAIQGRIAYLDHLRRVHQTDAESKHFDYDWEAAVIAERAVLKKNPQGLENPSDLPYEQIVRLDDDYTEMVVKRLLLECGKTELDIKLDQGLVPWKVSMAINLQALTTASLPFIARRLNAGSSSNLAQHLKRGQTPLE